MKRVIVIGSPGAGKSTFARALRDITGLPLYYLDMIHHKADGTNVPREEFDSRLSVILGSEQWIIDGNYQRTLRVRLESCDTVFLLDYPTEICLAGAAGRVGVKREDMPWVETEFDPEFRQFITDFSKVCLPDIYKALESVPDKDIVIMKSREQAEKYLRELESSYIGRG